jgi:hypothetical protein
MLFLVNRPWSLFSLGHSNIYYLISCDIPSLDLVIYFKCLFFSFDVKSKKTTPPPVCKAKCPQWQGMVYEMCTSSMACLEPMKLVWTTPYSWNFQYTIPIFHISSWFYWIPFSWSCHCDYFDNVCTMVLLFSNCCCRALLAISLIWISILHCFVRSPLWYTWQVLSFNYTTYCKI